MKRLLKIKNYLLLNYKIIGRCLIFLCLFNLKGCIEPFKIEVPKVEGSLVVDGFISTELKSHEVRLNLTTGYNEEELSYPLSGAVVRIISDQGDVYNLQGSELGVYVTEPLAGEAGKSYKIIIDTQDGNTYESEYESLIAANPFDDIYYETRNDDFSEPGILVYVKNEGSSENPAYYLWDYSGHQEEFLLYEDPEDYDAGQILYTCVSTERCYGCLNLSSDELKTGSTSNQFIAKVPYTSTSKYVIKIDQYSLSPKVYEFYSQINRIVNNSGTVFDTPPTLVRGNIKNVNNEEEIVLGYFYATDIYSNIYRIRRDIFSTPPDKLPILIPRECTKGELPCLLAPLQLPDPPPCANQPPVYWDLY